MTKNQTTYTIEAYEFKTSERLAADIEKAIEICNNLNIPISKVLNSDPLSQIIRMGLRIGIRVTVKAARGARLNS